MGNIPPHNFTKTSQFFCLRPAKSVGGMGGGGLLAFFFYLGGWSKLGGGIRFSVFLNTQNIFRLRRAKNALKFLGSLRETPLLSGSPQVKKNVKALLVITSKTMESNFSIYDGGVFCIQETYSKLHPRTVGDRRQCLNRTDAKVVSRGDFFWRGWRQCLNWTDAKVRRRTQNRQSVGEFTVIIRFYSFKEFNIFAP